MSWHQVWEKVGLFPSKETNTYFLRKKTGFWKKTYKFVGFWCARYIFLLLIIIIVIHVLLSIIIIIFLIIIIIIIVVVIIIYYYYLLLLLLLYIHTITYIYMMLTLDLQWTSKRTQKHKGFRSRMIKAIFDLNNVCIYIIINYYIINMKVS